MIYKTEPKEWYEVSKAKTKENFELAQEGNMGRPALVRGRHPDLKNWLFTWDNVESIYFHGIDAVDFLLSYKTKYGMMEEFYKN